MSQNIQPLVLNQSSPLEQNFVNTEDKDKNLTPLQKLLQKVNGQGTYQLKSFIIFNLLWFVTGWLLLGESFFFDDSYQCKTILDEHQCKKHICSLEQPKDRVDQIGYRANSIVFAFQPVFLICQLDYIVTILTSMIFIGSLLGFFLIPYLADNWGRRVAMRISWFLATAGVLIICVADSPSMVGIGYFLAGFGANPAITLCYSFINEQCLGKSRQRYGVIIQVFYAIGQTTIGLLFIQQLDLSWRAIFFIVLGLSVILNLMLVYLVQTPKFLIKKSEKKTLKAFNQIAKINKRPQLVMQQISDLKIQVQVNYDKFEEDSDQQCYSGKNISELSNQQLQQQTKRQIQHRLKPHIQAQSASLFMLFKYKSLIWRSIGVASGFLGIQVIYYCTSFNLDQAGYGKLINQEIVGVSQIFGYVSAQFIIHCVSRKKTAVFGMVISASICLLLAMLNALKSQDNQDVVKIVGIVGLVVNRFVLCSFWSIFYVYIAELFPTKVRSLAFGWASAVGTIGSTLSPYIIFFSKSIGIDSWILPGAIGLLMTIPLLKLPETFGQPSHDFIDQEEAEKIK